MAMSAGGNSAEKPMSDINTTPLVDVMLVLLIVFMIAIPAVLQTVKLTLPDVVYDPTRSDNEELSAQLAEQHVRADIGHEVRRLIRLTRTHNVQPDDRLGAILISIDLSILGAAPARYDAYAAAIRQEFIHVSDSDYRAGRAKVLRQFAARPVIYPDAGFAAIHEGQARDNLARELASLS